MRTVFKSLILAWAFATASTSTVAGETIYFLVGETVRRTDGYNDSYVLPLSKASDIAHARYLVSRYGLGYLPGDRLLAAANVVAATNDINRNFLDPKFPKWSWQVDAFHGFGDITAEELDGSPTQLEGSDWSRGGEATIGFWTYTVVRELGPVPLYLSIMPEGQNLEFYWSSPGTNHVYTLEGKESLGSTNWFALPGASWPLKTNHWSIALTNSPAPFYRVRAELSNP